MKNKQMDKDLTIKEFIKMLGWSEKKFYNNIELMCDKNVYDIDIGSFKKAGKTKEDYIGDENTYSFRKEWNDLALLLFRMYSDNPYFRANSNARKVSIDSVIEYNTKFLKAIHEDLNTYNSLEIQLHPVYTYTIIETYAMKKVKEKIELFLYSISKMPVEARAETMLELNDKLDDIIINSYISYSNIKENIEHDKGQLFINQLYGELENISLDKFVAQVLKKEMDNEFRNERKQLNNKAQKMRNNIDDFFMENEPKELVERVNEFWNKDIEDVMSSCKINILESIVRENINKAKEKVERSSDILKKINKLINYEKDHKTLKTKKRLKRLEELKEIISHSIENKTDFAIIAENLIQEINFSIINRK